MFGKLLLTQKVAKNVEKMHMRMMLSVGEIPKCFFFATEIFIPNRPQPFGRGQKMTFSKQCVKGQAEETSGRRLH